MRERPGPTEPLPRPVVDTHCHLDVVDRELGESPSPEAALAMAREAGITRIVQVGCDVASSEWAVEAARSTPEIVAAVALHPNDVPRIVAREGRDGLDGAIARIEELAGQLELDPEQMLATSSETGEGRDDLAQAVVDLISQPSWRSQR